LKNIGGTDGTNGTLPFKYY